jgi:CHAT domain-containing protein
MADPLAQAWELKERCYALWNSDPLGAAQAADALRELAAEGTDHAAREIGALVDWTGGIAHMTRGRMAEAVLCFDRASAAFRALDQAAPAAQTQVPKIAALAMLGQYDDAVSCAETTQRDLVSLGDMRGAGKVSVNLGALHVRRGDYAQAARHSREASVLFARVGDHEHSVTADTNLADALSLMGDFDEALRIFARARMRAQGHGLLVRVAHVDSSVALLQFARGHYREALAGFEASRRLCEQLDHPQHLAIAEQHLADAYLELRLLPEAATLFDKVLARFQTLDMATEQAWTEAQRGRLHALLAQPTQAEQSFERATALFAAQGCAVGEADVTLARAELALGRGDPTVASELAAQAAQGFVQVGLADGRLRADVVRAHALRRAGSVEQASALFQATLGSARTLQLLSLQVHCLTGQGLMAQSVGDVAAAAASFEDAVALAEDQRAALPGEDLRSAFLGDHLLPYQELLRIALQAQARSPSPARASMVLQQLERIRARSLGERLVEDRTPQDHIAATELRERLNWLYRRVQQLRDEGEPTAALTDELRRVEHELLERARRARLTASLPEAAPSSAQSLDVAALQAALDDGDALIEYAVQDDELFACIVTRDAITVRRHMARWSEVQEAQDAVRFQIDALRHGAAPVRQHLDSLTVRVERRLTRLHALVWAPLAGLVHGRRRLLVVPHGALGALPFAALHDGQCTLAERFELALVPSARLALRGLHRRPGTPRSAIALGESSRLPHAEREALDVAALFAQGQAFVGDQATLATLGDHASKADVIHLACHAQFRSDNPMFSALQLHDGALTAERAEHLPLRPAIVVLSACETALADHGGGDEQVGLVRAFLVAGASRVVASLWPVDDQITATFMQHFYRALGAGESPACALRGTQTVLMKRHPHPFFWAAFTLHGGF